MTINISEKVLFSGLCLMYKTVHVVCQQIPACKSMCFQSADRNHCTTNKTGVGEIKWLSNSLYILLIKAKAVDAIVFN